MGSGICGPTALLNFPGRSIGAEARNRARLLNPHRGWGNNRGMGKFKLSDTMQFLTGKLNAIRGGDVDLLLELDDDVVAAGEELRGRATVRSPESANRIEFLRIDLTGQVQRSDRWEDFVQSAEVAHDTGLPKDHEFVVPIIVLIPGDAVLTEDGATWTLSARASLDGKVDPRAERTFEVVSTPGESVGE